MEQVNRMVLSDKDHEVIENLQLAGLDRKVSTAIVALSQMGPSKSKAIEDATGLRQPEVSTAMKEMRRKGWVAYDVVPGGQRRPSYVHKLVVPMSKIIEDLDGIVSSQLAGAQTALARLRVMV